MLQQVPDLGGGDGEVADALEGHTVSRDMLQLGAAALITEVATSGNGHPRERFEGRVRRARGDDEVGQFEQAAVVEPGADVAEGVGADDEDEARRGMAAAQGCEGVYRVGRPRLAHLDVAGAEVGVGAHGAADHGQAVFGGGEVAARLVRRLGAGDEEDAIEMLGLADFFGAAQVAIVDGVEGPAEDAEAHAGVVTGSPRGGQPRRRDFLLDDRPIGR